MRYLLTGSIRWLSGRLRMTAQLIDARSGMHLWAQRYERTVDDIFALQDEITLILATELQVSLTEGEQARIRKVATTNLEAWSYWVQSLAHFGQAVTREQVGASTAFLEEGSRIRPRLRHY